MDIWRWVEEAQRRHEEAGDTALVRVLDRLPSLVCADEHAQVEALYPEALALARAAKNPWLEVFVRHWYLQSKVLHRGDVAEATTEATELLDFVHREDTRDCPQAICVVQDFANCYSRRDGPGYVEERTAVARETLDRIDGGWPCYRCIGDELADALLDQEDWTGALETIDALRAEHARFDTTDPAGAHGQARAVALAATARFDEALEELARWEGRRQGPGNEQLARCLEAEVLARRGDAEAALERLPAPDPLLKLECGYVEFARAVNALLDSGALQPHPGLDPVLWAMHRESRRYGRLWDSAELSLTAARMAAGRGGGATAARGLARAEADIARLRRPERSRERLDALRTLAAERARPAPPLPAETTALRAMLAPDPRPADLPEAHAPDHDAGLALLDAAAERWPDSLEVHLLRSATLRALGLVEEAQAELEAFVERHPDDEHAVMMLGDLYLATERHEALDRLAARVSADAPLAAAWIQGRSLAARRRWDEAVAALEAVVAMAEPGINARSLLAEVELRRGGFERATELLDDLVVRLPEPGGHDWSRMTAGACCGRWDAVRDSAARLGIEVGGDAGPIDDNGPFTWIQLEGPPRATVAAARRSPVTARVVDLSGPEATREVYGDQVVFDGAPVNLDVREEEGDDWVPMFRAVHLLERGGFRTYDLDGVHPGDAALDRIRDAVEELGGTLRMRSGEHYQLEVQGEWVPAVYAWFAVPEALPPARIVAALREATAELAHPLVWTHLARALGDERALAEQLERVNRYGIEP